LARITSGAADKFCGIFLRENRIGSREPIVEASGTTLCPPKFFERLPKSCDAPLEFKIIFGASHQHADAPHPIGLLRACIHGPG
jgi:hypothetical protein